MENSPKNKMSRFFILLTFVFSTSQCFPTCIRKTLYGKVRGKITIRVPHVEVEEYLGVPYASPPTGHLRYKVGEYFVIKMSVSPIAQ